MSAPPLAPPGVVNVANGLTVLRLLLVPVFAVLLLVAGGTDAGWRIAATAVFVLAGATDRIDGELARRRGLETDFGAFADPVADKALIGTALVGLSMIGELAWAVTVVVLVREAAVTLLRLWVIRYGVIPASRGGKLKTLLQGIAVGLYLLPLGASGWAAPLRQTVMAIAVAVTVGTGCDYVLRAVRLRRSALARTPKEAPRTKAQG